MHDRLLLAIFLLAAVTAPLKSARAALLPPGFLDCVVSIGLTEKTKTLVNDKVVETPKWVTLGTGFLYGRLEEEDNANPTQKKYRIYLVTAKHVIRGYPSGADIQIRVNSKDPGQAPQFSIPLTPPPGHSKWFFGNDAPPATQNEDVAAIGVDFNTMTRLGLKAQFFPSDTATETKSVLSESQVAAGDGIFVLGFPMNLAGEDRNYVIVRQGTIARISDMLDGVSQTFMLDAFVFPGNSGGPVVLKPDLAAITGTRMQLRSALIGMVTEYDPYVDIAFSRQTQRPRVTFEENSGLAIVVPMDVINSVISRHEASDRIPVPAQPTRVMPNQPAAQ